MVTDSSQAMGRQVTHIYLARCIFTKMVVATQRATVASNWFEMPKSGQRLLMPPRGSITP